MYNQSTFMLLRQAMRAIAPLYQKKMREAMEEAKLPDHWFVLSLARGAEPEPFSLRRYYELSPYTKYTNLAENLEELRRQKWLKKTGSEEYHLSVKGRKAIEEAYQAAQNALRVIRFSSTDEIGDLNSLLKRIVESVIAAGEPIDKWSFLYSRWSDPGDQAEPLVKADQYLTDLVRFRDDAHIAAWMPYSINPQAVEAWTLVWRREAHTAEELAKELDFRGFTAEDYRAALCELAARGWIDQTLDGFKITEKGKRLRQAIEKETDRMYFALWSCLEPDERKRLLELVGHLHDRVRAMTEPISSATNT